MIRKKLSVDPDFPFNSFGTLPGPREKRVEVQNPFVMENSAILKITKKLLLKNPRNLTLAEMAIRENVKT